MSEPMPFTEDLAQFVDPADFGRLRDLERHHGGIRHFRQRLHGRGCRRRDSL
ncbi:MAG: hypothetical protein MZW92_31830 [Comamonadaceae bacterium]|nr:hypothetical protein [Comamonadaceae bacterium]